MEYTDQRLNRIRAHCVVSTAVGTDGGGEPNGQIVSTKRAADGRRQRNREIIDEKGEKYTAKKGFLWNISMDSKGTTFVILINYASALIRKEGLSPTSKAMRETSQNEFMENGEVPDRAESFREVDSSEIRPRAWPGFVKPIRNGMRKEQNSIKSRLFRAEAVQAEKANEVRFQKEE